MEYSMPQTETEIRWKAGEYLRLSREDGDLASSAKQQSNSIENQGHYIDEYVRREPGIRVEERYVDDGYSGVDFARPGFQRMLEDARAGKINCIIVKDLSRLGRNYIETGKYIERVFPALGIRFIAINDNYDSTDGGSGADGILLPFKNLINDAYCRDISIKIRSHLEAKRKNGEFIGAFTVYGYKKGKDRHRLEIDTYAAGIVREIFRMKFQGRNLQSIADALNRLGILSPADYKREQGSGYRAYFQQNARAKWTAVSVSRILKNEVYTGTLVQGKAGTVNYKVKARREKAPAEWCRVENTHQAIISSSDFELVQSLLRMDTRAAVGQQGVAAFSGMAFCADCGCSMVRKKVMKKNVPLFYYRCSGNKGDKDFCGNHDIPAEELQEAVKRVLRIHINCLAGLWEEMKALKEPSSVGDSVDIMEMQARKQAEEEEKYRRLSAECYADYRSGLLRQEEYAMIRREMEKRAEEARKARGVLEEERRRAGEEREKNFRGFLNMLQAGEGELPRYAVVRFIERIYVYDRHRIEILFRYRDGLEQIARQAEEDRNCAERTGKSACGKG